MNESAPKSSSSRTLAIKIEDDDTADNILATASSISDKKTLENSVSSVRSSVDTITMESESSRKVQTSIVSKLSNDQSVELESDSSKNTGSSPSIEIKRSSTNNNENMDVYDSIAEIAASSAVRTRRGKGELGIGSTPKPNAPRSTSCIPLINSSPKIVTASMNNHYVPPIVLVGTNSATSNPFAKGKDSEKGPKNKISVHMLNSVGLECGDDGKLRLEHFDDDIDSVGLVKTEAETAEENQPTLGTRKQKPPMWTLEQHKAFAGAIFEIGLKNCSPSIIMENMRKQPRYITRERTKSHLQKYRQTRQRSKGEFLKEFDDFFKSIEKAKAVLNTKNANSSGSGNGNDVDTNKSFKHKEPIPKVILTAALEGKKPSKLLGGKAAALLSYSVLHGFSTSHGPDQLQYKAAKLTEFPSLTEEERRSSIGASLIQVKSLIDNLTDILLKTRHGIKPFPVRRSETGDYESVSSSMCSSDDEYSDEDEENIEGNGKSEKQMIGKTGSKDQDPNSGATVAPKIGGPFPISVAPGGPAHPLYRGPPTVYPAAFPAQGAPTAVATGFPPSQYPHAQPSFYGGLPPVAASPAYGNPAGYHHHHHHPQMHYTQDPRVNPYQQAPPSQISTYPTVPPMQPNYYPPVTSYPAYYGNAGESNLNLDANNASAEYPGASGDVFSNHLRSETNGQQRLASTYDQQSSSYLNDGRSDRRNHNVHRRSKEKRSREHSGRRPKHRRVRDGRATSLSVDSSDFHRTTDKEIGDFLDRLSNVPSPEKSVQNSSSSPVHISRREGRYKSSPPVKSESSHVQDHESRQRQYQSQFHASDSHGKKYGSPGEADHFSDNGANGFTNTFEASPVQRAHSERVQNQSYVDRQHHSKNNDRFWESSNFGEAGYDNQPQQVDSAEGEFAQQPAQLHSYASGSEHLQQQQHSNFDIIDDQQHASSEVSIYDKSAQSSPTAGSATNYFFGD